MLTSASQFIVYSAYDQHKTWQKIVQIESELKVKRLAGRLFQALGLIFLACVPVAPFIAVTFLSGSALYKTGFAAIATIFATFLFIATSSKGGALVTSSNTLSNFESCNFNSLICTENGKITELSFVFFKTYGKYVQTLDFTQLDIADIKQITKIVKCCPAIKAVKMRQITSM